MAIKPIESKAAPSAKAGGAAARASANRSKLDGMAEVVKRMSSARPAASIMKKITVVPTIFPIFDHNIGVGGLPSGRIVLVHGGSAQGKSPFGIGLGRSFLARDHFFDFVDAERATDEVWGTALMGDYYNHPGFTTPATIGTYEDVRAHARQWMDGIGEARVKGLIDPETTGIMLVDSIGRLIPKTLWDELSKATKADNEDKKKKAGRFGKPKPGIDGMGGRAGQIKAGFNAAWLGELIPLCADTRTTVVIIARETVEEGEGFNDDIVTVNGGRALLYDSSLWLRIVDEPVWKKLGDKERGELVGFRHTIQIRRSKVGPRQEKIPEAAFHTSNGLVSPLGFDHVRDVVELAGDMGVLETHGSYYTFEGEALGQGKEQLFEKLRADEELLSAMEAACRAKF